ncbi:DNA-binding helix-turn-helix protein [Clostridium sp. SS2/1]|nr:DNA-binding helix-turn-helix protein [Clostridium sp. SS2/1]
MMWMTVGERIQLLRKKTGMSQIDFATKINVSKQTLYKYENNLITNIPSDKIEAVADLCHVSPAYLMGWEEPEPQSSTILNKKDEKDIAKRLEQTLDQLESDQDGLMFSGEPLDDETRELLKASLQNSITIAKINAKQKFTPKKYRK